MEKFWYIKHAEIKTVYTYITQWKKEKKMKESVQVSSLKILNLFLDNVNIVYELTLYWVVQAKKIDFVIIVICQYMLINLNKVFL